MQDRLESILSVVLSGTEVEVLRLCADELGGCLRGQRGGGVGLLGANFKESTLS